MNILFLNISTANPLLGGVQCVAYWLHKYFVSHGHHVVMLAWQKVVDVDDEDHVYMPDADKILSSANKQFLARLVEEHHIDIVMNHTCLSPYHSKVLKFLSKRNVKIINVFHNSPFGMYGSSRNKGLKYRKWIDIGSRWGFVLKYRYWLNMQVKYSDRQVMLSPKFIPEYLFFAGKRYADKLTAMPNPLTIEKEPRCKKENALLFVGRLSQEKGLGYLLDIWHLLEDKYPDWRLDIVGDGGERALCERKIKEYGLKRCVLHGFQTPEPFYNRSKIFCMTSLFEGFGLVLVEAMAYGTVPLAFNSYANVGDIIDRGKNGLLVRPFDVVEYANTLSLLMDHPALLDAMSDEAVEKSHVYELERIGAEWEKMFEEVINEK